MSAYVASKTALIRLSEQLAMEMKPHGISVFPIRPGVVRTAMVEEAREAVPLIQKILDEGQDVTADVVADLVLFLASGKADRLSGAPVQRQRRPARRSCARAESGERRSFTCCDRRL